MDHRGTPHWVSKRNEARKDMLHRDSENESFNRIKELENENVYLKKEISELKREIADLKQRLKDFDSQPTEV